MRKCEKICYDRRRKGRIKWQKKIRNIKETNPELFNGKNEVQWDYEKNEEEGIKPEDYTYGSHKKVWWKDSLNHS